MKNRWCGTENTCYKTQKVLTTTQILLMKYRSSSLIQNNFNKTEIILTNYRNTLSNSKLVLTELKIVGAKRQKNF